jgi:hypothetical protein
VSKITIHHSYVDVTTAKPEISKITSGTTASPSAIAKPTKHHTSTLAAAASSPTILKITTPSTTTSKATTPTSTTSETSTKETTHVYTVADTIEAGKKNVTASPWNTSTAMTITNEIDTEIMKETEQTTMTPGIVTWTSFPDEVESPTKNPDFPASAPGNINILFSENAFII